MEPLFNPNFDWSSLVGERSTHVENTLKEVCNVLTAYGRNGIQTESGMLYRPETYQRMQQERQRAVVQMARETAGGFITPDMYPNFFESNKVIEPYEGAMQPDTTYLDWVVQRKMIQEIEDRKEWGFTVDFVRVRRAGQIEYGKFMDNAAQMTNEEWGAGIEIFRTWFETNVFGIKMAALAPEFRYSYFNTIADYVYAAVVAATWHTITPANTVVTDLNNAMMHLQRYVRTWDNRKPFETANFRLLIPPEFEKFMNAAVAATYVGMGVTEQLSKRIAVTSTPKLSFNKDACKCYLIADKWKQNELATRVPFGVFGSSTDIDVFADKMSYRGAWGFQLDPLCGVELTFDTDTAFFIAPPIPTRVIT